MFKRTCLILMALLSLPMYGNDSNELEMTPDGRITVSCGGNGIIFRPEFMLVYREDDPGMQLKNLAECRYFVPVWKAQDIPEDKIFRERKTSASQGGDGIDEDLQKKSAFRLTGDYFHSGRNIQFGKVSSGMDGDTLKLTMQAEDYGKLDVSVYDDGSAYPAVSYRFTAGKDGFYSIIYTGAPSCTIESAAEVWQPMVWQQKRFPEASYLTLAFQCSLPGTMASDGKCTWGVMADSSELPFQPLPSRENNNGFGVLLRNMDGDAQPMIAAPALGGENSFMKGGEDFAMKLHLVVSASAIPETYSEVARSMFGFKDYRRNRIASTNQIIENMVKWTMTPYSNFIDSLKGCSYSTDVPGSVKNVSSLHPLSIALVTDNDSLYRDRALPVMEYMLSRDNTLFCLDTTQKVQNPSRKLGRPCAPTSELIALYSLSGGNCGFLKDWAEDKFYRYKPASERQPGRGLWNDALSMYRSTGDAAYLDWAVRGADRYLTTTACTMLTTLKSEFFWTSYVPKYIALLDLYETTGDKAYLEASHRAARYYSMFIWMCPAIPDEKITVNIGNKAPWYWYLKRRGIPQQYAPEETVEAWRLSEIGLTAESSTTGIGHRAVFMAHHAPYFLKLAHYTGDTFLRDIARSAVVGRYRNFPGYHINTMRNTAYEQLDFPYHWHDEISASSFHYNHPFPHISILIDYLVTDAFDKSGERISFPSLHIDGYSYLQNRFYGCGAGTFYSERNAWLWMPAGLVSAGNVELNWLAARTDNSLCLAFMNQCGEDILSTVRIDTRKVPALKGKTVEAEVWNADGKTGKVMITDGETSVNVPAKGISSLIIKDCPVKAGLQEKFADKGRKWKHSSFGSDFGNMSALLIDMGAELKTAYIFLRDDDSKYRKVSLEYRYDGGQWQSAEDVSYPYEFSLPVPADTKKMDFRISAADMAGNTVTGPDFTLSEK